MTRFASAVLLTLTLTPASPAQTLLNMQYGGGAVKLSGEVAARMAVAGLVAEKFPFAEVTADGNVRGWNDKVAVLVLCSRTPDAELSVALVIAASADAAEAERVRNAVRERIFTGADDPKTPKRVAPADGKLPPAPAAFSVKAEDRTATPLLKHFAPVASLSMEKLGMATKPDGQILVLGQGPSAMCLVTVGPTPNAQNVKLNAVTITHGEKPAERLAEDVLSRVVKVLYE